MAPTNAAAVHDDEVSKSKKPKPRLRRSFKIIKNQCPRVTRSSSIRHKLEAIVEDSNAACPAPKLQKYEFQTALTIARKGAYELNEHYVVPELEHEDEIMIKTFAVGLNPIDWKSVAFNFCLPQFPWITGREMSGIIERVGRNVTTLQPGDRVWTSTYYRDVRAGCFQEYVVVPQHTVLPIPSELSFEQAACLGVAALTASMTLWKWLAVPFPSLLSVPSPRKSMATRRTKSSDSGYHSVASLSPSVSEIEEPSIGEDEWILIWGGSTVTGQFATQVSKLSGLKVITVCSSKTTELSRSLGADHVVTRDDRTDESVMDEVSLVTRGRISKALDLVGPKTAALCLDVCSRDQQLKALNGRKVIFAPLAMMSSSQVVPENVLVETVEMKRFVLDVDAGLYAQNLNALLEAKLLRLPEMHVLGGGLVDIEPGLAMIKKGDMGGKKVVVRLGQEESGSKYQDAYM